MRVNHGYMIIDSILIGKTEIVLGQNPEAVNPFVTWTCRNENDYNEGHYFNDKLRATKDFYMRIVSYFDNL